MHNKMGRSRFPGKPLKFQNRKRVSVLSGAVYHETAAESQPSSEGDGTANVFVGEKEEEEKKDNNNKGEVATEKTVSDISAKESKNEPQPNTDKSPVRTRSQNKMDAPKDKPKPVKKTVTFGTVESCEDTFLPLKKLPKHHAPLVPIIKKKSALKQTESSTFNSILKPAKLTDLSSKSSSDYKDSLFRKSLNPTKSNNKFSQLTEGRCMSPPPHINSEKETNKFILPVRSAHSSRVIKPNKKFIESEECSTSSSIGTSKVLKKPKLKRLVFNNLLQDDDTPDEDELIMREKLNKKDKFSSSNLFKDKTTNSFNQKSKLFSFDKDTETSADENSNHESQDKTNESHKEERGHAMRKLMDISDASSTSSTGSESEESWESDSAPGSADDEEKTPPSPEREKAPASQLLSGKVIIREARLQLNTPAQSINGPDGPFSSFGSCNSPTPPTTVTCGVCGAVRFYKFVKQARKFGIYSCESCRKFISKMLKKEKLAQSAGPVVMQCLKGEGNCHVPAIVRSQQWKWRRCANKPRCPACWLKMCLKAFQVPPQIRAGLTAMLPTYMRSSTQSSPLRSISQPVFGALDSDKFVAKKKDEGAEKVELQDKSAKENEETTDEANRKRRLIKNKTKKKDSDDSKTEDPKRQKVEIKGPRVKHVCRSASIVLGQPIATFPTQEEKDKVKDEDTEIRELEKDRETPDILPEMEVKMLVEPEEEEVESKKRRVEPKKEVLSEDETAVEIVARRAAMKPLTNITNSRRGVPRDEPRPEVICVDFWESYDPDEVCTTGFGVIGTAPFTVPRLCFLCGSAGKEKLSWCGWCMESSHSWCGEEAARCGRCVTCAQCGGGAARARCRLCDAPHHARCLTPPAHNARDWPQICQSCLKCKSCDSPRVTKFVGSLPFCASCFKLRQKGNYCPLCQACYRDNDFDSKMMECGWCARWVHASCEGLSGEGYQLLSALPPSIEYICRQCMPHDPPWRNMLTEHLKGRLLHLLKLLAKNKNACALLKLTPHKNTPVAIKGFRISSPQAIRKLHFGEDDDIKETKVYRNTTRRRKLDPSSWGQSVNEIDKQDLMHSTQKVVNLQEPLMQNKEICFTTSICDPKEELNTPCVEVHENNHPEVKQTATLLHIDKYEAISDDDEPVNTDVVRSEQDQSPAVVRPPGFNDPQQQLSPTLLDIKKRVNTNQYISLKDFNHDMKEVIERLANEELKAIYKDLFSETFPWFDCMNNCLQPNLEVEGINDDIDLKDQEMPYSRPEEKPIEKPTDQVVPKYDADSNRFEDDLLDFFPLEDTRVCVLCKLVGDGEPVMEGRLLYCGQNDWIHANCALWSAEVFEEIDGSLQNVHSAISRGKMIKCAACELKGASVGCCAKNCSETYHYSCARKADCAFLDDKRVFCPPHGKDVPKQSLQKETDFELTRPVYVELDKKKKRYSEINKVQFLLGSLSVHNLGKIVPSVSDHEDFLMPVDFHCTRLFWSSKKPSKVVKYTLRTKLILAEPTPGFDFGVNITVDHSLSVPVVDRVMAEIGAWHECIEKGGNATTLMLKNDRSPIKFRNTPVTLEDIAVKQVVDHLLDCVCKLEQDEEEPQNTADLLPPELKDAIFEDLNHDLLDGISMQDIFPKLMSYEDLVAMDLKNEFYGAIAQSDDRTENARSTTDFIDELLNARLESGSKELKRSKSEMLLQNHNLKTLTTGRGQQRSSSLTWNNKFDTSLLKRCKMGRTSTATDKLSPIQKTTENLEPIKEDNNEDKKTKPEASTSRVSEPAAHTSGINYRTTSPLKQKDGDTSNEKSDKEGYYTDVIDFYTKIQCSPIAQLDGAEDWSGSESTCSSRPNSPRIIEEFTPIQQLDGAEENSSDATRTQNNQYLYRASGSESSYTVTITGNSISGQPELVMRPLDDSNSQIEQPVRCDRCQCTYRNKESYDRHIPSCDLMSTSESESENPKSPENRTLTTLQNAFQGAFAQPMIIHAGVVNTTENTVKAEGISARRTSINTRQITINGTIVETPSPGPSNEMTMTITEQMKSGTVYYDQSKNQVPTSQVLSSPQIVVTPQMFIPPKTTSAGGQKIVTPQLITQQGVLPYNICVKPGNGGANVQQIQGGDMAQLLSGPGSIQVISSSSNQMLTIPSNHTNIAPMMHGKNQVTNFPNMASASSITVPVNSGMSNASIIQNIQPMIRPNLQGNPTIVMPAMTAQRLATQNMQNKHQIILPGNSQKSPKKHPMPVQPKPIFQAANRGRGRQIQQKPTTIKRQTKVEKTFTTINQPLGAGNTVIQLQTNNQTGQPSIIVQPVANQNIMSAYVEALSQQQNQNMQYIATIGPQGDFKATPQFISQGGIMPQTFQIQQTENGGLVAVPSGGIPVLLPQGNVGILPQTLQQGTTILPQGTIQQGIISQGPNGPTILPQAITQNGTTIIPQSALQGLTPITSQATLLPNNTLQSGGTTVVPHSNAQTTILPNTLNSQGNTILSSAQGATILPQGTILPQFCNDQVLLGSTPTLEMVTDPNGCMYLTTTQPVYYGLETIVQNTVMSSQQFVSTAMQGVLAQNSSFSATTTQVFQASKIEPIVEVPTGYVVVNNVGESVNAQVASSNAVTAQVNTSPQIKTVKTPIPNLTLQPLPDKPGNNRQTTKVIQMSSAPIVSQPVSATIITGRQNLNPITSQIHSMTISGTAQALPRQSISKPNNVSMAPSVTLVSSTGQPVMAISQSIPISAQSFSLQSIPLSQPIASCSIAPSINRNTGKIENSHVIEIGGNLQENSNTTNIPTISVTQTLKSPTPWRQVNTPISISHDANKTIELQNTVKTSAMTQNNMTLRHSSQNELDKTNCLMPLSTNTTSTAGPSNHMHQFDANMSVSHHSTSHTTSNNVIQISSGNIYSPQTVNTNFDAETAIKLSKINALSKTEGGHLNFSQEIMASHSQQHAQNEKTFQNIGNSETKHIDTINNQINMHKMNSCQMSSNTPSLSIVPHNIMRPQSQCNQSALNQNQLCSITTQNTSHSSAQSNSNNLNLSCQEVSNRVNISLANDNNIQQTQSCSNQQHLSNSSMNAQSLSHGNVPPSLTHGNVQMMQENSHHNNQIHILNGQIQHNRSAENTHLQSNNMMNQTNRTYHENMHASRTTPDTSMMNQSMNMHHNLNRSQNELNHMHMSPLSSMNNVPNNRMMMDNLTHQMHTNRSMDPMHNQMVQHNQMNQHINNTNHQMDSNMHMNQQMSMQQNRQMENVTHHHQHQMSNVMQMQNTRHLDNNLMGIHQHIPNQMHNRQIENMHMHHGSQNLGMSAQIDANIHNRHDNSAMSMPNLNINQMQNNRNPMEHSPLMQHPMNNMNLNMHTNMQINNASHQPMMHVPEVKNDMQNSCGGSCASNSNQFNNQSAFDIGATAMSGNNMNIPGNMMHGMNNPNMSCNMMMNNNNSVYGSQPGLTGHDIMMACNNPPEHNVNNLMAGNNNHMMMNNSQSHANNNQNQIHPGTSDSQMNMANTPPSQLTNMDRSSVGIEQNKFVQESCRGKNVLGTPTNNNMGPIQSDCAKVNIISNDKQNHTISVNNQMGFMPMNTQNNRVINLPDRGRLSNENNMNQHIPQHNIRVVTNNTNNVAGINSDPFQQKTESSGTMINVPFQAIPNSAPMNINVNSSNNTVNITVQNNLVDPKIASKASDLNFPLQTTSNLIPNQNNASNMICIPVQNSTISLPTQNSTSITLPKAPPTQQSGIPTNVVNPMSMRPMNRVLPLHRDGQSKTATASSSTKAPAVPKQRPVAHDMPDLNIKDDSIDSDLEKAIEESKRMMELESVKREKEDIEAARALQLSSQDVQPATSTASENAERNTVTPKMPSLPCLDTEMEVDPPKAMNQKDVNKQIPKIPAPTKIIKRSITDKKSEETVVAKKQTKSFKENKATPPKQASDPSKDDGPKLIYEVTSEDGFSYSSSSLTDLWAKVVEAVQNARKQMNLPPIKYNFNTTSSGSHLLGLNNNALRYLVEQLPGASRCTKYVVKQGRQLNSWDHDLDLSEGFKESPWGSARTGPVVRKLHHDMFSWMASPFREEPPVYVGQGEEISVSRRLATLPLAMRFRHLKETSKVSVGVFRSHIHGRGLFCKRDIEEGAMVIEYAGEVIRAVVADQREKRYEGVLRRRGVAGCYMFRIDDNLVVDATLKGNAARFINHSCDPNCYSRVVDIHGHKHILIFALRRISIGEELTYDYKFPFEDVKIPCTCGAKKCRKYLN